MNQASRHAIVTCLTAILLLALLHGQRLADELEEKGFPSAFPSLVHSASNLSPARILDAMRWSANVLASLDRRPGQDADDFGPQDSGSVLAEAKNVYADRPDAKDKADVQAEARVEAKSLPDSNDRGSKTSHQAEIRTSPGSIQIPTLAVSHPLFDRLLARSGQGLAMSHEPFGQMAGQGSSKAATAKQDPAKVAENTAMGSQTQTSGLASVQAEEDTGRAARTGEATTSGKDGKRKSIFEHPLSRRYKVLLVGDSFMEDITLALMRNFYYKDPYVQYINVARHSTGLCISSKWNWRQKLAGFVSQYRPDVVMIYIGANDLQNIIDDGRRYSFTSDAWKKRYEEIAASLIDIAASQRADVIWIGMPVMGIKPYETWMPLVSSLQRKACESRQIEYIDTVPTLADANGKYQVYMKDAKGQMVRLRKDDRYHVSYDGCLLLLDQILPSLKKHILKREKKNVLSLSTFGNK